MNNPEKGQEGLDRYLDGLLEGDELAAFEKRLEEDPGLAQEVDRHRALEGRLRKAFTPPGDARKIARRVLPRSEIGPRPISGRSLPALGRLAAAALLLVTLVVGLRWLLSEGSSPTEKVADTSPSDSIQPVDPKGATAVALAKMYDDVSQDVDPTFASCSSDGQLAPYFAKQYGQELCVDVRPDIPIRGPIPCKSWCGSWPSVTVLAGSVDARPVLVLVDARGATPPPVLEPESPYQLFRRNMGDLVLYELSPLPEARLLDLFYNCD